MLGAVWFSSDSFCDKVASLNPDICVEMEQWVALRSGTSIIVLYNKDCSNLDHSHLMATIATRRRQQPHNKAAS